MHDVVRTTDERDPAEEAPESAAPTSPSDTSNAEAGEASKTTKAASSPRSLRRRMLRWGVILSIVFAFVFTSGVFVVIPWLGERGDLNYLVEEVLHSMLDVPVRIDSVESEPLGKLSLTKLRSVSAAAADKLRFEAEEISVHYDPVELVRGEIREVSFIRPQLYINFDEDLRGLAFLPKFPQTPEPVDDESPLALPFTLRRMVIDSGTATVRLDGRDLLVDDLTIEVDDLGSNDGLRYELRARILDAKLEVRGRVEIARDAQGDIIHRLPENELSFEGVRATAVFPWLRSRDWRLGDSETGRLVEQVDELVHSAAFGMTGTVDGVWGEDLGVKLVTRFDDLIAGDPESIEVLSGRLDLLFEASIRGFFETVGFRLDALASGTVAALQRTTDESGSMQISGEFQRSSSGESSLEITSAQGTLLGGGQLEIAGDAKGLFRERGADLDVRVDLRDVRTAKILDFVPPDVVDSLPATLSKGRGEFSGHVSVGGTALAPVAQGRFDIQGGAVRLPGTTSTLEASAGIEFERLAYDRELGTGSVGRVRFQLDSLDAAELVDAFRARFVDFPAMTGKVRLSVDADQAAYDEGQVEGDWRVALELKDSDIEWTDGSGGYYGVDARADVRLGPRSSNGERSVTGVWTVRMRELLWHDVYAEVDGDEFRIAFDGHLALDDDGQLDALRLAKVEATTPVTGLVSGYWSFDRDEESGELGVRAELEAPDLPMARAYEILIRDPLATDSELFETSTLEGRGSAKVSLGGTLSSLVFGFVFEPEDVRFRLGDLEVDGLRGTFPLRWGANLARERQSVEIAFDRARRGPLEIPGRTLRFDIDGENVTFVGPLDVPLFGGSLRLNSASRVDGVVDASVDVRGVSLERLADAYDLPRAPGRLDAHLGRITYDDGSLRVDGEFRAQAFGGTLRLANFAFDDVFEPYSNFRVGIAEAKGLELVKLGETFRFGLASGILGLELRELEYTAGELTSFELDVETVKRSGVDQYIDRRAIESIRRVLSGPFGAIEETFFSKFYFDQFGFVARLDDGVFFLRGKHREDGVDYLMSSRWYQVPQVSIINARPDQPYDWPSIVQNLREIYRGEATTEVFPD